MQLIDSHAHLDLLDDAAAALARARAAGVVQVVTIGVDRASSLAALELAKAHPEVYATLGLHPHDAEQGGPALWQEFRAWAERPRVVGLGECGLDYYRDLSPRPVQREAFGAQIALARELGLPLVVHIRDALPEALAMLEGEGAAEVGGVVHCFSGGPAEAARALELGFHLGLTGVLTFPKAGELKEVARTAPLERLLVETDCPYLAPAPFRGKKNEPAYVAHTLAELARLREIAPAEAAAATTANTRRLFRLPEAG
ncbi:MAG: TatD family hydrolase [Deltaproteobacteria bacterium]|nr:TatD family hydrolase [Deltaproteobacteria bacterium]